MESLPARRQLRWWGWCALGAWALCGSAIFNPGWADPLRTPYDGSKPLENHDEPLAGVKVEGNISIPDAAILRKIHARAGRSLTPAQVRDDVRKLYDTRWFFHVDPIYRQTDEGTILVFRVLEKPVIESVRYEGNGWIRQKYLEAMTGLKPGGAYSVATNREAAQRILQYYHDKGYYFAEVELLKGDKDEDRDVVFKITEGHKVYVSDRRFTGNKFFSAGLLRTKLETTPRYVPYFGGTYQPRNVEADTLKLREYYHRLGFFDVKVDAQPEFSVDKSNVVMQYTIDEGLRYKIRSIHISGNRVLSEESLRQDFNLKENEYFNGDKLNRDLDKITDKYGELGRLFAEITATPRYRETPGEVDIEYRINEDRVYRIRRIDTIINGANPHTKESVILNSMLLAPGDLANKKLIEKSERRLRGIQIFDSNVMAGTAPKIDIRRVEGPGFRNFAGNSTFRGQTTDEAVETAPKVQERPQPPRTPPPRPSTKLPPRGSGALTSTSRARLMSFAAETSTTTPFASAIEPGPTGPETFVPRETGTNVIARRSAPPANSQPGQSEREIRAALQDIFDGTQVRAQSPDNYAEPDPLALPPSPNDPLGNPPPGDYREPEGLVDLVPQVTETQTGRLMFGVGFNSDAGVTGSVILDESNFDLLKPPKSLDDLFNGNAWRGGGQQFRIEAVPGNQVSRYMLTWRDPYFLNTPYSLGVSGFYYTRIFNDWYENRAGGRVTVGRQIDNFWSGTMTFRLEDVELYRPTTPSPKLLTDALGHNFLSSIRLGLQHDTRDSAFLPSEGHYVEAGFEQAFGDFDFPKADLNARQFFTVWQRADGEGRHIVALNGQMAYTGSHTPIFERLYAGGYSSFRGFQFRGVTPRDMNVGIGGQWMAVGSAEYIFPITASEMLRGVAFTDFGTVENNVTFKHFRATAGVGVRVTVPAMGPLPIAIDLAWPLAREEGDKMRILNFYMGLSR